MLLLLCRVRPCSSHHTDPTCCSMCISKQIIKWILGMFSASRRTWILRRRRWWRWRTLRRRCSGSWTQLGTQASWRRAGLRSRATTVIVMIPRGASRAWHRSAQHRGSDRLKLTGCAMFIFTSLFKIPLLRSLVGYCRQYLSRAVTVEDAAVQCFHLQHRAARSHQELWILLGM